MILTRILLRAWIIFIRAEPVSASAQRVVARDTEVPIIPPVSNPRLVTRHLSALIVPRKNKFILVTAGLGTIPVGLRAPVIIPCPTH
jgi:hypothetical protein